MCIRDRDQQPGSAMPAIIDAKGVVHAQGHQYAEEQKQHAQKNEMLPFVHGSQQPIDKGNQKQKAHIGRRVPKAPAQDGKERPENFRDGHAARIDRQSNQCQKMQYAEQHQWSLPKKRPLHMIDHSFGPTGEFIFPVSLAMLSEAAKETCLLYTSRCV